MNQVQHELMHYGILGMHWGKHKAQAKGWVKEAHRHGVNDIVHPILTSKARRDSFRDASTKDKAKRLFLYSDTKALKDINARTTGLISANREKKAANAWQGSGKGKAIGKSVVAGLVASNLGGMAVLGLTKNMKAAQVSANFLAVYGGMKYYQSLKKDNNR